MQMLLEFLMDRFNDRHEYPSVMNWKNQDDEVRKGKHALSIERYIPLLMMSLKHARMYPSEAFSKNKIVFLTGLVIILIVLIFVNSIFEIMILIIGVDLDKSADVISILSARVIAILKWLYCTMNSKGLFDIVKKLDKCHLLCQRTDRYKSYKNEIEWARKSSNTFCLWWFFICTFAVVQWCIAPLLLGTYKIYLINDTFTDRQLPYIAWSPLDTHNVYNYIILYNIQTIGTLSVVYGYYCYDSFYITMLIVITAQLRYINATLNKNYLTENEQAPEAICNFKRRLRNCVDCHTEIIQFVKLFQTFASPIMFVQCLHTLIGICSQSFAASAVKLTLDEENMFELFNLLGYCLALSLQLWFSCFFASRVTDLASQIPHSVYSSEWEIMIFKQKEELSNNKQLKCSDIGGLVQMIMVQAQKLIVLTGGPFYVFSMETFRVILSVAISNSVMLRQLSNHE